MTRDNPDFRDRFRRNLWLQMARNGIANPYALWRATKANGTDLASNNFYRFCAGDQEPSASVITGIAKALGCTVDDLVKEEETHQSV